MYKKKKKNTNTNTYEITGDYLINYFPNSKSGLAVHSERNACRKMQSSCTPSFMNSVKYDEY